MSLFSGKLRDDDRRVAFRVLISLGVILSVLFLVVALLTSHFVNLNKLGSDKGLEGDKEVITSNGFYDYKEHYSVLPSIASLGSEPLSKDVIYTKEYQVSRSVGFSPLDELEDTLESLDSEFFVARPMVKAPYGYHLFAVRSEDSYIVYSYVLGVVAIGSKSTEDRQSLESRFGGESGDLLQSGFVSSVKRGSWVIHYLPEFEVVEEVFNSDF